MVILEWIAVLTLCALGALRPLHVLQSQRYQLTLYRQWLSREREHWLRSYVLIGVVLSLLRGYLPMLLSLLVAVEATRSRIAGWLTLLSFVAAAGVTAYRGIHEPMKKPLVLTMRMRRLFGVVIGLTFLLLLLLRLFSLPAYLAFASPPYAVWLAERIMDPVEEHINAGFYNQARRKLMKRKDLIKIGITGSYGKTFTKFILKGLLDQRYSVLATPASFNTAMGISRVVNEELKDEHEVFIAEMGAQHRGDIKSLARLVGPTIGMITSIGNQHVDAFGSIANIVEGKFELITALPEDGAAFFASDSGYVNRMYMNCRVRKFMAAVDPQGECAMAATDLRLGPEGMRFDLTDWHGETVHCQTQLLGRYNAQSIALAAAVARYLGLTMAEIRDRIAALPPFEKRLELIHGERLVIDDSMNDGPLGATEALSVLSEFPGRRIIVTPGLPVQEPKDEEANYAFGAQMKGCVDTVVLVGDKQSLRSLARGLASASIPRSAIRVAADPDDAEDLLDQLAEPGDTVLYEGQVKDWR